MSHLLRPDISLFTPHPGAKGRGGPRLAPTPTPARGVRPLGTPAEPAAVGPGRSRGAPRPVQGNSEQARALALPFPPGPGGADNDGGKCLSAAGLARALPLEARRPGGSKHAAALLRVPASRSGRSVRQVQGVVRPRRGRPSVPPHAEPTVSQQPRQRTPGRSRGFPPGWDAGGSGQPRAACAPGPAPLTHTQ